MTRPVQVPVSCSRTGVRAEIFIHPEHERTNGSRTLLFANEHPTAPQVPRTNEHEHEHCSRTHEPTIGGLLRDAPVVARDQAGDTPRKAASFFAGARASSPLRIHNPCVFDLCVSHTHSARRHGVRERVGFKNTNERTFANSACSRTARQAAHTITNEHERTRTRTVREQCSRTQRERQTSAASMGCALV